jgi:hypothetical protein
MGSGGTDREVLANRTDLIIKNKTDKICLLIDVAIHKKAEKNLKYKNLGTKIQRMWNVKCFVIPLITGTTVIVTEILKNLETVLEKHPIGSLHKTAVLGTSHIIRKVLQSET